MIRGAIFDVDGTLIDSNEAQARAWKLALERHGVDLDVDAIRRLIGMGGDQLLPALTGLSRESEKGRAIAEEKARIFRVHFRADVRPLSGARELIEALHSRGLVLAAASSAEREELEHLLRLVDPRRRVTTLVANEDVDRSKPSPSGLLKAAELLGLARRDVVAFGDTPYDVAAARAAGIALIAFRSGGWKDDDLTGALEVWDGPAQLLEALDRSTVGRTVTRRAA